MIVIDNARAAWQFRHLLVLEKEGVRQPILILYLVAGTTESAGVTSHIRPPLCPRERRVEVAISDFVASSGDPAECRVYIALLPSFGPLTRQG